MCFATSEDCGTNDGTTLVAGDFTTLAECCAAGGESFDPQDGSSCMICPSNIASCLICIIPS